MYFRLMRNPAGGWKVVDPDGKTRLKRHTLRHAKQNCDRLNDGLPPIRQTTQLIHEWPALRLKDKGLGIHRFRLVEKHGVTIKSFKEKWRAEWWLREYEERRRIRLSMLNRSEPEKELLDWIEKRWLVGDEAMDFSRRVQRIERLLRDGLA